MNSQSVWPGAELDIEWHQNVAYRLAALMLALPPHVVRPAKPKTRKPRVKRPRKPVPRGRAELVARQKKARNL